MDAKFKTATSPITDGAMLASAYEACGVMVTSTIATPDGPVRVLHWGRLDGLRALDIESRVKDGFKLGCRNNKNANAAQFVANAYAILSDAVAKGVVMESVYGLGDHLVDFGDCYSAHSGHAGMDHEPWMCDSSGVPIEGLSPPPLDASFASMNEVMLFVNDGCVAKLLNTATLTSVMPIELLCVRSKLRALGFAPVELSHQVKAGVLSHALVKTMTSLVKPCTNGSSRYHALAIPNDKLDRFRRLLATYCFTSEHTQFCFTKMPRSTYFHPVLSCQGFSRAILNVQLTERSKWTLEIGPAHASGLGERFTTSAFYAMDNGSDGHAFHPLELSHPDGVFSGYNAECDDSVFEQLEVIVSNAHTGAEAPYALASVAPLAVRRGQRGLRASAEIINVQQHTPAIADANHLEAVKSPTEPTVRAPIHEPDQPTWSVPTVANSSDHDSEDAAWNMYSDYEEDGEVVCDDFVLTTRDVPVVNKHDEEGWNMYSDSDEEYDNTANTRTITHPPPRVHCDTTTQVRTLEQQISNARKALVDARNLLHTTTHGKRPATTAFGENEITPPTKRRTSVAGKRPYVPSRSPWLDEENSHGDASGVQITPSIRRLRALKRPSSKQLCGWTVLCAREGELAMTVPIVDFPLFELPDDAQWSQCAVRWNTYTDLLRAGAARHKDGMSGVIANLNKNSVPYRSHRTFLAALADVNNMLGDNAIGEDMVDRIWADVSYRIVDFLNTIIATSLCVQRNRSACYQK